VVKIVAFWIMTPCFLAGGYHYTDLHTILIFHHKNEDITSHQNAGNHLPICALSWPRWSQCDSPPRKLHMFYTIV